MSERLPEKPQVAGGPGSWASPAGSLLRRYWGLLAIGGVVLLPIAVDQPYFREIIGLIFLWSAMAGAWNIVGGYAGKFSLGHAAFFGVGAYTSALLYTRSGVSPWIGILAGMALSVLLALFIGIVTLRLKGKFFALCTIAFGQLMEIMAVYLRGVTGGSEGVMIPFKPGILNLTFSSKLVWVYIFGGLMLSVYGISRWLEQSALGYKLIALREDEDAAEALGVNTLWAKLASISLSAALTSLGGSLFAQYFAWLEPGYCLSLDLSIQFSCSSPLSGEWGLPSAPYWSIAHYPSANFPAVGLQRHRGQRGQHGNLWTAVGGGRVIHAQGPGGGGRRSSAAAVRPTPFCTHITRGWSDAAGNIRSYHAIWRPGGGEERLPQDRRE